MNLSFWMVVLGAALLAIAAVTFTVVLERYTFQKKQEGYEDLHRRMGLDSKKSTRTD